MEFRLAGEAPVAVIAAQSYPPAVYLNDDVFAPRRAQTVQPCPLPAIEPERVRLLRQLSFPVS